MIAATRTARPGAFSVFRKRSFALLWTAQLISTAGSALTSVAASILVYRLTGSALSVGLMLMATSVPSLVVGLIAGVFVDRWDRRRVMIAADLIRGALAFLIPFLIAFDIAWLYVIVMLSSAVGQFFDPAHASLLPEVASDEELAAANALMQISSFGSTAIGFAASGLIASRFPIAWAFYADALSFVLSATCTLFIRIPALKVEETAGVAAVLRNLRAGLRFLFGTPILRSLFLTCLPAFAGVGLLNALLLPLALRSLHATEFGYGVLEALSSGGFVAGALLLASLGDRLHAGQWVAISYMSVGMLCIVISQMLSFPVVVLLYTAAGFCNAPNYVGRSVVIQRHTPRDIRGRVNSAFFVTRNVMYLVGMGAAGLADLFGPPAIYLAGGLFVFASGILALMLPGLRAPAAEWRRAMAMLRSAPTAPGLGLGYAATLADLDRLAMRLPDLAHLSALERR